MKNEKYLPLGSVVLLEKGTHKLMIIGFCTPVSTTDRKVCDYIGCLFPEGVISMEKSFAFNHSDIKEIFYKGFYNEESEKFHNQIKNFEKQYIDSNGNLKISPQELLNAINKK